MGDCHRVSQTIAVCPIHQPPPPLNPPPSLPMQRANNATPIDPACGLRVGVQPSNTVAGMHPVGVDDRPSQPQHLQACTGISCSDLQSSSAGNRALLNKKITIKLGLSSRQPIHLAHNWTALEESPTAEGNRRQFGLNSHLPTSKSTCTQKTISSVGMRVWGDIQNIKDN